MSTPKQHGRPSPGVRSAFFDRECPRSASTRHPRASRSRVVECRSVRARADSFRGASVDRFQLTQKNVHGREFCTFVKNLTQHVYVFFESRTVIFMGDTKSKNTCYNSWPTRGKKEENGGRILQCSLLTLLFPLEVRGRRPVWIGLGDFNLVSLGVGDNLLHG